ncbi:MAG: glycosyltransferase, partial [Bacteroidetes bacterium]|nr:glycosyltransferase [Bacteroidota bacterium]
IILRYPGSDFSSVFFTRIYPIIYEFHSDIFNEFRLKIKSSPNYLTKIIRTILFLNEKLFLKLTLRYSLGFIANSYELEDKLSAFTNKKSIVSPNAISISERPQSCFSNFDGKVLKMLLIASRPDLWHGIDRLLNSCDHFLKSNKEVTIELNFAGEMDDRSFNLVPINKLSTNFHGVCGKEKLQSLVNKCNIAIAPLALYRKGMNSTSAIKVADYINYRIPFIIGYEDSLFLKYPINTNFVFIVENNISQIDINEVIKFINDVSLNRMEILNNMDFIAKNYLDWSIRFKEYINFAKRIITI